MGDEREAGAGRDAYTQDFDQTYSPGEALGILVRQAIGLIASGGVGALVGVRYFAAVSSPGGADLSALAREMYIAPLALVAGYMAFDLARSIHDEGVGRKPFGFLAACAGQVIATCILLTLLAFVLIGVPDLFSGGQPVLNWLMHGLLAGALLQAAMVLAWFAIGRAMADWGED